MNKKLQKGDQTNRSILNGSRKTVFLSLTLNAPPVVQKQNKPAVILHTELI